MRFDLKDYIIGHSSVADEEIIIGDKVGRFIPIDLETLPEIISILQSFVDDETRDTVSPCEFENFGEVTEELNKIYGGDAKVNEWNHTEKSGERL